MGSNVALPAFLLLIGAACFLQGVAGFGFALLAAPVALLFLDKITVVVSLAVVGIFINAFLFRAIRQTVNLKLLKPLFIAAFIGMPLGILILRFSPIAILKITAGSISVLSALLVYGLKARLPMRAYLIRTTGFLSGILHTSIGMSGPPIALLLTGTGSRKDEFRKTIVSFFLVVNIVSLPLLVVSTPTTWGKLGFAAAAIPTAILGGYLGNRVAKKVPQTIFRAITLATVFLAGLVSIYSGLRS